MPDALVQRRLLLSLRAPGCRMRFSCYEGEREGKLLPGGEGWDGTGPLAPCVVMAYLGDDFAAFEIGRNGSDLPDREDDGAGLLGGLLGAAP